MKPPKEPKFKIAQPIYHITPESSEGFVLDVRYSYLTGLHEYVVAFNHEASLTYYEHELSAHRTYGTNATK